MRFAFFPLHLSKVLRLPRKSDARSYEVLNLSRKIIFPKLKISCSKMQPLSGNQRPDLLTALMNMSRVLRLPRDMHLASSCQILCICPTPAIVFETATKPSRFAYFRQGAQSLAPATPNFSPWFIWFDHKLIRGTSQNIFIPCPSLSQPSQGAPVPPRSMPEATKRTGSFHGVICVGQVAATVATASFTLL